MDHTNFVSIYDSSPNIVPDSTTSSFSLISTSPISPTPTTSQTLTIKSRLESDNNEPIFCWLCRDKLDLTSENSQEEFDDQWVTACVCEGVRKYAHQKCLLTYIINSKYYNPQWETKCSWCNVPYLITVDGPSIWYRIQSFCDNVLGRVSPWLVSTGLVLSIATLSYCYSDALLCFIHGREEFFELFDCQIYDVSYMSSRFNLILMPISLIYFESYNWEHFFATKIIQHMLKQRSVQWQNFLMLDDVFNRDTSLNGDNNLNLFPPNLTNMEVNNPIVLEFDNTTEPSADGSNQSTLKLDISNLDVYPRQKRNFLGYFVTGLAMPFVSYVFASFLFPQLNHNLARTYLGWSCIQAARGIFRIAYQVHAINLVTSIKIYNRN